MKKPTLKYADGKLIASAEIGLDLDHDGKNSVGASINVEIDAMEAVGEIVKDGAPQWLKDLISSKS